MKKHRIIMLFLLIFILTSVTVFSDDKSDSVEGEILSQEIHELENNDYMEFIIKEMDQEINVCIYCELSNAEKATIAFAQLITPVTSKSFEKYNPIFGVETDNGEISYYNGEMIGKNSNGEFTSDVPDWMVLNEEDYTIDISDLEQFCLEIDNFYYEMVDNIGYAELKMLAIDNAEDSEIVSIITEKNLENIMNNLDFVVNMDYETDSDDSSFTNFVNSAGYLHKFSDGTNEKTLSDQAFELIKSVMVKSDSREEISNKIKKTYEEIIKDN